MKLQKGRKSARGQTLIEAMIALIIMSIGILGIAGMQVLSLQQNRGAMFRAEATQLGNDLMDRLRVNTGIVYNALLDADPTSAQSCEVNPCTPVQMAAFDIAQWKCSINSVDAAGDTFTVCKDYTPPVEGITGSLPLGAGSVALVNGVYEVTVQWSEDRIDVPCGSRTTETACASITLRAQVN